MEKIYSPKIEFPFGEGGREGVGRLSHFVVFNFGVFNNRKGYVGRRRQGKFSCATSFKNSCEISKKKKL